MLARCLTGPHTFWELAWYSWKGVTKLFRFFPSFQWKISSVWFGLGPVRLSSLLSYHLHCACGTGNSQEWGEWRDRWAPCQESSTWLTGLKFFFHLWYGKVPGQAPFTGWGQILKDVDSSWERTGQQFFTPCCFRIKISAKFWKKDESFEEYSCMYRKWEMMVFLWCVKSEHNNKEHMEVILLFTKSSS